jgi:hypothetical protein
MKPSVFRYCLLAVVGSLLLSAPSQATSFTFSEVGSSASEGSARQQSGTVVFDIEPTFITVTLTNDDTVVNGIAAGLTGVKFTLGGAPGTLSLVAGSGTAAGEVDCTTGNTPCDSVPLDAANWGWALTGGGLFAGNGSYKPYAIANANTAQADGIANAQHNPLLLGPVSFTLHFTGTEPTGVSAVSLYWGTGPETQDATPGTGTGTGTGRSGDGETPVPEPASLLLLGTGLAMVSNRVRNRNKKRK